jgi:hypothetical protein
MLGQDLTPYKDIITTLIEGHFKKGDIWKDFKLST